MLIHATDTSNKAFAGLHVELEPLNATAGDIILWKYTGDTASPVSGNFSGGDPSTTLMPLSSSTYDYILDIAIDNNNNSIIDSEDNVIRSFTVKVITNTDYSLSYNQLYNMAKEGDLVGLNLASSLLLTFLGIKGDAPITSYILPDILESTDKSLSHVAGETFNPVNGTDLCKAGIKHYVFDNNEAADIIVNSKTIQNWIEDKLNIAFSAGKLIGNKYSFPYDEPTISFGNDKTSDAFLALGSATPINLLGIANIYIDLYGKTCIQDVTVHTNS